MHDDQALSQREDLARIVNHLPHPDDYAHIRHLDLRPSSSRAVVEDDILAQILSSCPHLETAVLSGAPELSDRSLILLAETSSNLQGLGLTGCRHITDVGILELTTKSLPLQWVHLNGVLCLTDPSISAIAKTCAKLSELDLRDLPLLTPLSIRDVWTYSRKLRSLRLARCALLTDKAFPSHLGASEDSLGFPEEEKPLPPRPTTWIDKLPPLMLAHSADNLRILDISYCDKITDDAIEGIVIHAPRIQNLALAGCTQLTNKAIDHICLLMDNLDSLSLAHVSNVTDGAIVKLHLAVTGVPALKRKGTNRFSDPPPSVSLISSYNADQQAVYRVFSAENIVRLCKFLDKEERRRRESEVKNIPFTERSDDEMALY
ncbi:hypothetical protein EYR36_006301 [Pleurotus pulmonarius]|nr:hypothetical protein EYR36_006301 [Pleurotus pulmonarius]